MHIDEGANVQLCQSVRGQMSLHAIFGQGANVRGGTCPTLEKIMYTGQFQGSSLFTKTVKIFICLY